MHSTWYPTTHSAFWPLEDLVVLSSTEPHLWPVESCQGLGFALSALGKIIYTHLLVHPIFWEMINVRNHLRFQFA